MSKSSKSALDNRANQLNPKHRAYHQARGSDLQQARELARSSKPSLDGRANQLNPDSAVHGTPRDSSRLSSRPSRPSPARAN